MNCSRAVHSVRRRQTGGLGFGNGSRTAHGQGRLDINAVVQLLAHLVKQISDRPSACAVTRRRRPLIKGNHAEVPIRTHRRYRGLRQVFRSATQRATNWNGAAAASNIRLGASAGALGGVTQARLQRSTRNVTLKVNSRDIGPLLIVAHTDFSRSADHRDHRRAYLPPARPPLISRRRSARQEEGRERSKREGGGGRRYLPPTGCCRRHRSRLRRT